MARRGRSTPSSPARPRGRRSSRPQGHPDILVLREGGRIEPFNFASPIPQPYVPRSLTFEVPERIGADGEVVTPLDEAAVLERDRRLQAPEVEAVAVCLLWSIVNPAHERRVGELLERAPARRAVHALPRAQPDAARVPPRVLDRIDASLKPLMSDYLRGARQRGCARRASAAAC